MDMHHGIHRLKLVWAVLCVAVAGFRRQHGGIAGVMADQRGLGRHGVSRCGVRAMKRRARLNP